MIKPTAERISWALFVVKAHAEGSRCLRCPDQDRPGQGRCKRLIDACTTLIQAGVAY